MDIVKQFKENGYFTAHLYHLLSKKKEGEGIFDEITPSEYLKEMRLTTSERLQKLNDIEINNRIRNRKKSDVVLSFTPKIIIFQNFKPNERIITKFTVRNISKVPICVNMVCKESLYFSVKYCGSGQLEPRLAPGISFVYVVAFMPLRYEDYVHEIIFNTEKEKYIVPLIGMGPRPLLNFPDKIDVPPAPIKIASYQNMLLQNIGHSPVGITLTTLGPFSIHPHSTYLSPGEKILLRFTFKSLHIGTSFGHLKAKIETGESFKIEMKSTAYVVNIELEKSVVRFLPTYNTMVRRQTLKIKNLSSFPLRYLCMKNDSIFTDFEDKVRFAKICYKLKELESAKCRKLIENDIVSSEEHEKIYSRIFYDEILSIITDESMLYRNAQYDVVPIKGTLWPNQTTEISITFSPKEIGESESIFYLDVDGIFHRFSVTIYGTSLPPAIHLNIDTLNMDVVYINNKYNYEVSATNKGHINGMILYKGFKSVFGSQITCTPDSFCLEPGDSKIFNITYYNSNKGSFFEELVFGIHETNVVLKLYMKGEVICPALKFNKKCLNFGKVSLGMPKTLEIEVINETEVSVDASVGIPSDGPEVNAITLKDFAIADFPKPDVPNCPREFEIKPQKFKMEPNSVVLLQVTLTANAIRSTEVSLELQSGISDNPPVVISVFFDSNVPMITPAPEIEIESCFIEYGYKEDIKFSSNEFRGYFSVIDSEEQSMLQCISEVKEGFIEPDSTFVLPVVIKSSVLGVQQLILRLRIFGLKEPIDICQIRVRGVKAIVDCTPGSLQWNRAKLLTKTSKQLILFNDSPIPVPLKASLAFEDGRWDVSPTDGCLEPETKTILTLTLYLRDSGTFKNKVTLELERAADIIVPLSATGVGSSIYVGELGDRIDLGRHFTKLDLSCNVILENRGSRLHTLFWCECEKPPKGKPLPKMFFELNPRQFKLASGNKIEINIKGKSFQATTVKEIWYLIGSIEGINKKELLIECEIQAEFVDPKIEISPSVMELRYDYGPYNEHYNLTDILTIQNTSRLPLFLEINVRPPFAFIEKTNTYKVSSEEKNLCCCISCNESDYKDNGTNERDIERLTDCLTFKPISPVRTSPLNVFEDINKLKKAFHFTHYIEESLEDEEVMKIQVVLDTTQHLTKKSMVYSDKIPIKFRGHRNKDSVTIMGRIYFPNIRVITPRVDFQCIQNGSIENKTIKLCNAIPLKVCYTFRWKELDVATVELPECHTKHLGYTIEVSDSATTRSSLGGQQSQNVLGPEDYELKGIQEEESTNVSLKVDQSLYDFELIKEKLIKKINPMLPAQSKCKYKWKNKLPGPRKSGKLSSMLTLLPHRGFLKANEVKYVQVVFRPKDNVNVKATLECEALGGPTEHISVKGKSSDICFELETQMLNFKIREFYNNASESFRLYNSGLLPFAYRTFLNEPKIDDILAANILEVDPSEKTIKPYGEVNLQVLVKPGVLGYFKRSFVLEIGCLPHLTIELEGWGVISQVYLSLPRPDIMKCSPELCYEAISSLTSSFLNAINVIFEQDYPAPMNSPFIEKCFEDSTLQEEWHICSSADEYPTIMDIELAIERTLFIEYIKQCPEVLLDLSQNQMESISDFSTVPYVIDFGVVIIENTAHCVVEIVNYSPVPIKVRLSKGTIFPQWLNVNLCGKLDPGKSANINIIVSPISREFPEVEQETETSFSLEVPGGVKIPLIIHAIFAVPYLTCNVTFIDFGSVRCGDKVILSIPLKNIGKATCVWYVTLRLKVPGLCPVVIHNGSGKFERGEGDLLKISFAPVTEMRYEGTLIFRIHMNPNRLIIPLTASGIKPRVHIIGSRIDFPAALPWCSESDIYFGLTNPCPFPIELIFPHVDEKWKEEEEILELLNKYYDGPDEMLVPLMKPGAGFPLPIVDFYRNLKEHVRITNENQAISSVVSLPSNRSSRTAGSRKSLSKRSTACMPSPSRLTEAEIIYAKLKTMKENKEDPLKECLNEFDDEENNRIAEEPAKGIMIFFHGNPCEGNESLELAYYVGNRIGLPIVNIDTCFVDALCVSKCDAKLNLMSSIEETYDVIMKCSIVSEDTLQWDDRNTSGTSLGTMDVDFDTVWKKLITILGNQNAASPRSKVSEKNKKKSAHSSLGSRVTLDYNAAFPVDLIEELFTDYFTSDPIFSKGFVVDTLNSIILKVPDLALKTVLRSNRSISNIHFVFCHIDLNKWLEYYEKMNKLEEEEVFSKQYTDDELTQIINELENMTGEEYEDVSAELKAIYINYGLRDRRTKYLHRFSMSYDSFEKAFAYKETDVKPKSQSDISSKKKISPKSGVSQGGKPTNEILQMNIKYNEYMNNVFESLATVANNWIVNEGEMGFPLYGFDGRFVGGNQKKSKNKSDVQLQESTADRGFPLTMVMYPCMEYKDILAHTFATSSIVINSLREVEKDILLLPVKREEYSKLLPKVAPCSTFDEAFNWSFLEERPIKRCDCFCVEDLELLDDATPDRVFDILSRWHCVCGKQESSSSFGDSNGRDSSQGSNVDSLCPQPLQNVKAVSELPDRVILDPGDLMRCKYTFKPKYEGRFKTKGFVEVCGWPESRLKLEVTGSCDIPRMDSRPKKMFSDFVRRTVEAKIYKTAYLDDQKVFDFGPIFIGPDRIYAEEYILSIKNSSLLTTEIEIDFLELTTVFEASTNLLAIEVGNKANLTISAAPIQEDSFENTILFSIKNNPEVIAFNIRCQGVIPNVQILPESKILDFGKILLYRRENDKFIVKNDSIISVTWKLRNASEFVEDFIIFPTSGVIPANDNEVVSISFMAYRVGVVISQLLIIDIYDGQGRGDPMFTETLYVSAECYDVLVDCLFEDAEDKGLEYGEVKVNSTYSKELKLINRGKYNIYFRFKKVKKFPEPKLLRAVVVSKDCGVIPPDGSVLVKFECTPTSCVKLAGVPAYTCSLVDSTKDQITVAKFPVCISMTSFYNTFTLFPLGELNFHVVAVGDNETKELIIANTGNCPLMYEIVLPEIYHLDQTLGKQPSVKDKIKFAPLKCGNFTIFNEDNLVAPKSSRSIQIQFMATAVQKFEETIRIVVNDTCPAEAEGVQLKLSGIGAVPSLDIWNIETTFREHLIVKNISDYKVPESAPHCVFVEDTVTMHFFCVSVNTTYAAALDLYNNGLVPSCLKMRLQYQASTENTIFFLDKTDCQIEPLLHKKIRITFAPKGLEEYRAVLEIELQLENVNQVYKICLIGEGVIPRIQIISPNLKHHKVGTLHIPITCLGSVSHKPITFTNISSVKAAVTLTVLQQAYNIKPIFWLNAAEDSTQLVLVGNYDETNIKITVLLSPNEVANVDVFFHPIRKGRAYCDVKIDILDNPYESFTVLCKTEAFLEDIILMGLDILPLDLDLQEGDMAKPAPKQDVRKKSKTEMKTRRSTSTMNLSYESTYEPAFLKYKLDIGGCEVRTLHRRTLIMFNNSEKVYKFTWQEIECIVFKPVVGYISPGEEKDIEVTFFSSEPLILDNEVLLCSLSPVRESSVEVDTKGFAWDNRQTITMFERNSKIGLNNRNEDIVEQKSPTDSEFSLFSLQLAILYSASAEYTSFICTLGEEVKFPDTFIHQMRTHEFEVTNTSNVVLKVSWDFEFSDEFPRKCAKLSSGEVESYVVDESLMESFQETAENGLNESKSLGKFSDENMAAELSSVTLFSGDTVRSSADTWFEGDLPFQISPCNSCIDPHQTATFKITFQAFEAFQFKVNLWGSIDNLDPYYPNVSAKITARTVIPYCYLDVEESDYLTSGRRKVTDGVALPQHIQVLEFNVLGTGCHKKSFNIINPTENDYEFTFAALDADNTAIHCDTLGGYIAGGISMAVTFTFSTAIVGVYETRWQFKIIKPQVTIDLLVVGIVREPDVVFVPTILTMKNSLVGFTTTGVVALKNNENVPLKFEFKGNSLTKEPGFTPLAVEPENGTLLPQSETQISIHYTPAEDGPLSFKIYCSITHMSTYMTLCVYALSNLIKPKVTYNIVGYEHDLDSQATTNIHLDKTASTYERTIPFTITNEGSATFFYQWYYATSSVKKYLNVSIEPRRGHVAPGQSVQCPLSFILRKVPVREYPVTLTISNGPEYSILIHAEIEKPCYHFSYMSYDFGKCFVNAPDETYHQDILVTSGDKKTIIVNLDFTNTPELLVNYEPDVELQYGGITIFTIYFRPKEIKEYEFKLRFVVNSLCEEIITIRGEGVPLLFDLYEGCQKSFNLGPVKVGTKCVRKIQVMNYSKIPIDASFYFKDFVREIDDTQSEATTVCIDPTVSERRPGEYEISRGKMLQRYKDDVKKDRSVADTQNALASLKIVPIEMKKINPHRRVPLTVHFKPIGIIKNLDVQLIMRVLNVEKQLVRLCGSATGMSLCLSHESINFGQVPKRSSKVLKVVLFNKGDFNARFWWQPLRTPEFAISPMQGTIVANSEANFAIVFKPVHHCPFIKAWASCNIENYKPLELTLHATCLNIGNIETQTMIFECPVREVQTQDVRMTNPTDEIWKVVSEITGSSFNTLKEFKVQPNSVFNIPITFQPRTVDQFKAEVLYSPLGENALLVSLTGVAGQPKPNGTIVLTVAAKEPVTQGLLVRNLTEFPEKFVVNTEVVKITPPKFDAHYECQHTSVVQAWGEAAVVCPWTFVCYGECEMQFMVTFTNKETGEYQYYEIFATVTPSGIVDALQLTARARETAYHHLAVANPLAVDTDFHVACEKVTCPDIVSVSRNSVATLTIAYSPFVVGETEDQLEVSHSLVGSYVYRLMLSCLPAKEKSLEVSTPLGTKVPVRLRIQNRANVKATFTPNVTHPSIIPDPEYNLGPAEKNKVIVIFEPTKLGLQCCQVSLNSDVAGDFVFNITGNGTEPKPQGPVLIRAGEPQTIEFKNVFSESTTFKAQLDREEFVFGSPPCQTVRPKTVFNITVNVREDYLLEDTEAAAATPTGTLTVTTPDCPAVWTYFLQCLPK